MCPLASTSSKSAGFWAWKSGWLNNIWQQQKAPAGSSHLKFGHSAHKIPCSRNPCSSRITFIPLNHPAYLGDSLDNKSCGGPHLEVCPPAFFTAHVSQATFLGIWACDELTRHCRHVSGDQGHYQTQMLPQLC